MPSSSSDPFNRERLHLRLEPRLLGQVKRIAKRRGVTVTSLIEEGMRGVVRQDEAERAEALSRVVDAEQV
jgi:predicted DNA-binding ribbon-helix-helix protein